MKKNMKIQLLIGNLMVFAFLNCNKPSEENANIEIVNPDEGSISSPVNLTLGQAHNGSIGNQGSGYYSVTGFPACLKLTVSSPSKEIYVNFYRDSTFDSNSTLEGQILTSTDQSDVFCAVVSTYYINVFSADLSSATFTLTPSIPKLVYKNGDGIAEMTDAPTTDINSISGTSGGTVNVSVPVDSDTGYVSVTIKTTSLSTNISSWVTFEKGISVTPGTAQIAAIPVSITGGSYSKGQTLDINVDTALSKTDFTNGVSIPYSNGGTQGNVNGEWLRTYGSTLYPSGASGVVVTNIQVN